MPKNLHEKSDGDNTRALAMVFRVPPTALCLLRLIVSSTIYLRVYFL